jgi:peptidoglycan/LPS O-acetylase OafA/YrhL
VESIRRFSGIFWAVCVGIIVLFVFFAALQAFSPGDVLWLSAVVAVLAVVCVVHFMRTRRYLDEHEHDAFRRHVNAFRERRGF